MALMSHHPRTPSQSALRAAALAAVALWIALAAVVAATLAGTAPSDAASAPRTAVSLTGTLRLAPGTCSGGKVSGTYLRMILPSGGVNGPYMSNADSRCSDQSFTPLGPGTDGGLRVGSYQPIPSPAFAANGDAKANRVTAPAPFYGTSFATATNQVDPQTKKAVPAPRLTLNGSTLTADLRSFSVTWNNQHFNQGAPKPDGSTPGNTKVATGTYDARTGAFTLEWASQVVGGPFDKFTGKWHFAGQFVPDRASAPTTTGGQSSGGTQAGTQSGAQSGTQTGASAGAGTPAGTAGATGAPVAPGAVSGNAPVVDAQSGDATAAAGPVTKVVTKQDWHVSWPVVGLAGGLALLGFGALILLSLTGRRGARRADAGSGAA